MNYPGYLRFHYLVYWTIAGVALGFACKYWMEGQRGDDLSAFIALVLFPVAVKYVFKGFRSRDQRLDERQIANADNFTVHGS